jgi:CRISPR-associated protein Cas1
MQELIIENHHFKLSLKKDTLFVKNLETEVYTDFSLHLLECLVVFGNPKMTTPLIKKLATKGIDLHFFSISGKYLSSVFSDKPNDYEKQKGQCIATLNENFNLSISQKIIASKILNQIHLLQDYGISNTSSIEDNLKQIDNANSSQELIGFEGIAARDYFALFATLIPKSFKFTKRERPATDLINALLNFGYSYLYSYIKGSLIKFGLNPGFGVLHKNRRHHATLASDLMESYRQILIDDTILQLLKNRQITAKHGVIDKEEGYFINNEARQIYLLAIKERMREYHYYFGENDNKYNFYSALNLQIESISRAFKSQSADDFQTLNLYAYLVK